MDEHELIQRLKRGDDDARKVAFERYSSKINGYVRKLARIRAGKDPETGRWHTDDTDVDDILGETFFQFFRDVANFKGKSALSTYLHSIARRRTIDFYRDKESALPRPLSALPVPEDPDDAAPVATEDETDRPDFADNEVDAQDILAATREHEKRRKVEQRLRREAHAGHAAGKWTSRSENDAKMELEDALSRLTDCQREVVILRQIQGLTTGETAEVLGKDEGAVKMALLRGLQALSSVLRQDKMEEKTEVILHD